MSLGADLAAMHGRYFGAQPSGWSLRAEPTAVTLTELGVLTVAERTLVRLGRVEQVRQIRRAISDLSATPRVALIERTTGQTVRQTSEALDLEREVAITRFELTPRREVGLEDPDPLPAPDPLLDRARGQRTIARAQQSLARRQRDHAQQQRARRSLTPS